MGPVARPCGWRALLQLLRRNPRRVGLWVDYDEHGGRFKRWRAWRDVCKESCAPVHDDKLELLSSPAFAPGDAVPMAKERSPRKAPTRAVDAGRTMPEALAGVVLAASQVNGGFSCGVFDLDSGRVEEVMSSRSSMVWASSCTREVVGLLGPSSLS